MNKKFFAILSLIAVVVSNIDAVSSDQRELSEQERGILSKSEVPDELQQLIERFLSTLNSERWRNLAKLQRPDLKEEDSQYKALLAYYISSEPKEVETQASEGVTKGPFHMVLRSAERIGKNAWKISYSNAIGGKEGLEEVNARFQATWVQKENVWFLIEYNIIYRNGVQRRYKDDGIEP